jgi:hypothetical protein
MATIKRFEDLEIWQMARQLCKEIFELTLCVNFIKDFSLKDQIRGSSGSIMDNIAEGFERGGNAKQVIEAKNSKMITSFMNLNKTSSLHNNMNYRNNRNDRNYRNIFDDKIF